LGYARDDWQRLAGDLKRIAETGDGVDLGHNGYGRMYVVGGRITGPSGRVG